MIQHHKSGSTVPLEVKAEILNKLKVPGCRISELAKNYNISRTAIYSWQQDERREKEYGKAQSPSLQNSSNFVELAVVEQSPKASSLQKASLTFNDFSLTLEGKLKAGVLLEIMKILEESSC
jgi:transposase-like protein